MTSGVGVHVYCACCTAYIDTVPEDSEVAIRLAGGGTVACPPCYVDEENRLPCGGPYRWVEYENDDGSFEVLAL